MTRNIGLNDRVLQAEARHQTVGVTVERGKTGEQDFKRNGLWERTVYIPFFMPRGYDLTITMMAP